VSTDLSDNALELIRFVAGKGSFMVDRKVKVSVMVIVRSF